MLSPARANWIGRLLLAIAGLCGPVLLGSVAEASAAPKWLEPVDLSVPLRDASNADVGMDDAGNLVAVWERSGTPSHPIQASVREAGGSFSAPIDLAATGTAPQVTMSSSGTAIVVFAHFDAASAKNLIQARIRPPGGSFAPAVEVAALEPGFSVNPRVAVNAAGDAAVAWLNKVKVGEGPVHNVVEISTLSAGGGFSAPVPLSDLSHEASEPDLAVNGSGEALVVWSDHSEEDPEDVILFSSGKDEAFTTATPISTADNVFQPEIALSSAGDPTVVWTAVNETEPEGEEEPEAEPAVIEASGRTGAGEFSPPVELSDSGEDAVQPQVAIGATGEAIAAWSRFDGTNWIAQAAIRPPGDAFASPVDLSDEGGDAERLELAMNGAGAATAVWQRGSPTIVQASVRPPGGGFGSPLDVSVPGQPALFPQVAMDQAGDGVAVWVRSNGTDNIAQAGGYDANPPVIRSLSMPPAGTVGVPVAFSVDPFDVWSIASTAFDFGDGSGQAGSSASHSYAAPGVYKVTATVADHAGDTAAASGTIAIEPVYDFKLGKRKRNKKRGTIQITIEVPGPGTVAVGGKGVKQQRKRAEVAGAVKLLVAAKGKARRRLNQKGKARVRVLFSFVPDGGDHSAKKRVLLVLIKR